MDNSRQRGPYNRAVVLNCIRKHAPISRTRIRALTGIPARKLIGIGIADTEGITTEHVFEAARQGDKLARGIVYETGRYLGIAVANAVRH